MAKYSVPLRRFVQGAGRHLPVDETDGGDAAYMNESSK